MRIVVTGATGNLGTSVLAQLGADPGVHEIVGLARRPPTARMAKTTWAMADLADADLTTLFADADAVIHLAWLIQPSRDQATLRRVNVEGSARVFHAVASAGVPVLAYASSVGAYSPGPKDHQVDEQWPTGGIESSYYSRQKAELERLLDRFEKEAPDCRVVRLRPGLVFKRDAATEIRRYFAGPFLPDLLVRNRGLLPVLPVPPNLIFQAVHSLDAGEAFRLAVTQNSAHGPFNVAADPILDPARLAALLGARPVRVPAQALRLAAQATWKARLQPTSPGWLDMALQAPLMDTSRAEQELGWRPRRTSEEALAELLEGMGQGAGSDTPPLSRTSSGPLRVRELLTGIGGRSH